MLSRVLTVVLVLFAFSCGKKEFHKNENDHIELVSALNQGNYQLVIDKLEHREDLSPREIYYLASAKSQAGGVDVNALYPVLEIQLFHKNALDWKDIGANRNPYLKYIKKDSDEDKKKQEERRQAKWKEAEDVLKEKLEFKGEKPTLQMLQEKVTGYTEEEYTFLEKEFTTASNKIIEKRLSKEDYLMDVWVDETVVTLTAHNEKKKDEQRLMTYLWNGLQIDQGTYLLWDYYYRKLVLEDKKERYLNKDKYSAGNLNISLQDYLNVLWSTYEGMAVIKRMPDLSEAQQDQISEAMDQYFRILKVDEFREVAFKNIVGLLSASLLSYYKASFDASAIEGFEGLVCNFNPKPLFDNYPTIRKRLLFMAQVLQEKNPEEMKESFINGLKKIQQSPEFMSEEDKVQGIQVFKNFQIDQCILNS